MRLAILMLMLIAGSTSLRGQQASLPRVFLLGGDEALYETVTSNYGETMLTACGGNMEVAMNKWLGMLQEMENYAKKVRYDLKGIKMWMHVFWDTDGSINHIAFRLRSDSRNVRHEEITAFLNSFMNRYKFPVTYGQRYAHYVGVTFPTFIERAEK
jgi:hypothetical protein